MDLVSHNSRIFSPIFITENYLETKFMHLPSYVFDVDNIAKIISGLSITVLEKKFHKMAR